MPRLRTFPLKLQAGGAGGEGCGGCGRGGLRARLAGGYGYVALARGVLTRSPKSDLSNPECLVDKSSKAVKHAGRNNSAPVRSERSRRERSAGCEVKRGDGEGGVSSSS